MENKPLHYDGSFQIINALDGETNENEELVLTDEMRENISGNPYIS